LIRMVLWINWALFTFSTQAGDLVIV
jgi:hypothetical protein